MSVKSKSLNLRRRKESAKLINSRNQILVDRIMDAKSDLSCAKFQQLDEKRQKLLRKISLYEGGRKKSPKFRI
jgi:hypothetical protein